jgi:hypothetical protein
MEIVEVVVPWMVRVRPMSSTAEGRNWKVEDGDESYPIVYSACSTARGALLRRLARAVALDLSSHGAFSLLRLILRVTSLSCCATPHGRLYLQPGKLGCGEGSSAFPRRLITGFLISRKVRAGESY